VNGDDNLPLDPDELARLLDLDRGIQHDGVRRDRPAPTPDDVIRAAIDAVRSVPPESESKTPPTPASKPGDGISASSATPTSSARVAWQRRTLKIRRWKTSRVRVAVVGGAAAFLLLDAVIVGHVVSEALHPKPSQLEMHSHVLSVAPDLMAPGKLAVAVGVVVTNHGGRLSDVSFSPNDDSGELVDGSEGDGSPANVGVTGDCALADDVALGNVAVDCASLPAHAVRSFVLTYEINSDSWGNADLGNIHIRSPGGADGKTIDNATPFRGSTPKWSERPSKLTPLGPHIPPDTDLTVDNDPIVPQVYIPPAAVQLAQRNYFERPDDSMRTIDALVGNWSDKTIPLIIRLSRIGAQGHVQPIGPRAYIAEREQTGEPDRRTGCRPITKTTYSCGSLAPHSRGDVVIRVNALSSDKWRVTMPGFPKLKPTLLPKVDYDPHVG
jgi:hypothetical protein